MTTCMGVQAEQDMFHAQEPPQSSRTGAFTGRGRTLAGDAPPQEAPTAGGPAPPAQLVHTITFYTNGIFTVNDGELPSLARCFVSFEALHGSIVAVPNVVMASISLPGKALRAEESAVPNISLLQI